MNADLLPAIPPDFGLSPEQRVLHDDYRRGRSAWQAQVWPCLAAHRDARRAAPAALPADELMALGTGPAWRELERRETAA
ncbi:MAG: hypothetical protein E7K72_24435 [Roseomonas mucosa]|nr:hypothetical protein [Roseomonas mucosa]